MPQVPTAPGQQVFPGAHFVLPKSNQAAFRIGRQIEQSAGNIAEILERRQVIRDRATSVRALNALRIQSQELQQGLLSDPDTENRGKKYGEGMQQLVRGVSEGMSQQAQEMFLPTADNIATAGYLEVDAQSFKSEIETGRAAEFDALDATVQEAAGADSSMHTQAALIEGESSLQESTDLGYFTDEQRVALSNKMRVDVAEGKAAKTRGDLRDMVGGLDTQDEIDDLVDLLKDDIDQDTAIYGVLAPARREDLKRMIEDRVIALGAAEFAMQQKSDADIARAYRRLSNDAMKEINSAMIREDYLAAAEIYEGSRIYMSEEQDRAAVRMLNAIDSVTNDFAAIEAVRGAMDYGVNVSSIVSRLKADGRLNTSAYTALINESNIRQGDPATSGPFETAKSIVNSAFTELGEGSISTWDGSPLKTQAYDRAMRMVQGAHQEYWAGYEDMPPEQQQIKVEGAQSHMQISALEIVGKIDVEVSNALPLPYGLTDKSRSAITDEDITRSRNALAAQYSTMDRVVYVNHMADIEGWVWVLQHKQDGAAQ